jgi:hypothetical protein
MTMPLALKKRAPHRTVADVWMRLAGELAVVADSATQGANAARRHDGPALASLIDRLRVAILDAIKLHSTKHKDLDEEVKS